MSDYEDCFGVLPVEVPGTYLARRSASAISAAAVANAAVSGSAPVVPEPPVGSVAVPAMPIAPPGGFVLCGR
ncbi:hypothetical protein [Saccharopolyspora sp. 5N708]|uniref:hypothetical protein n=1 Tax=Saccharopolyspora sp. 5N708 TaxID=3457424 RepID=UPI003FCEEB79